MKDKMEMKEIVDVFEMKKLTDAFVDSSNRSRFIIIVIVFTSILAAIAYWNTQPENWMRSRLQMANYVISNKVWELERRNNLPTDSLFKEKLPIDRLPIYRLCISNLSIDRMYRDYRFRYYFSQDSLPMYRFNNDSLSLCKSFIYSFSLAKLDSLKAALRLCRDREFHIDELWKGYLSSLDRLRTEKVLMIQVPIFGVSFDVNDLSLLGGFSFIIILLWFNFSLWRESMNLKIVFDEARKMGKLGTCYRYLLMRQLLMIPKPLP